MLETRTVFINSQQENGTICLVDSISPTPAKSDTLHRRNNRKQTTLKPERPENKQCERTSLSISQPQQRTTLHLSLVEETTENKQHLNETTEKTNNIKQNNTKESLHLLIWATFYVPNRLLFIERESRDNREREREKKNNHLQHLITNETEMNKCNRNYP